MTRREFLAATALAPTVLASRQGLDEAGFVPLFDGASLSGWSVIYAPESAFVDLLTNR